MAINQYTLSRINEMNNECILISKRKYSLIQMIYEAELPEYVYNSNAIAESPLTLEETEKILLEMEVPRKRDLRAVYAVTNLAQVLLFMKNKTSETRLSNDRLRMLHSMLLGSINNEIAGRFRQDDEHVRLGIHIAPAPANIEHLLSELFEEYTNSKKSEAIEAIAKFHLKLIAIQPFVDGTAHIARALINWQLTTFGYPGIIIRYKDKKDYQNAVAEYLNKKNTKPMEKLIVRYIFESLHKRLAYRRDELIVPISEYAKKQGKPVPAMLNAAKRQSIPAFRERGVWSIGIRY
ncbi:hypothetical protein BH09PAT2_BH09PAT2_04080 [soil metagenome]